jgi:hypothetical protein
MLKSDKSMGKYTSYCGLCCRDCIPGKQKLFEAIENLEKLCGECGLEKYVDFKSNRNPVFKEYPTFIKFLGELKKLKCSGSCIDGPESELGCTKECKIRQCVLDRKYEGCWDCDFFEKCELILRNADFHPGLLHNLKTIKNEGIENWIKNRGKHYTW